MAELSKKQQEIRNRGDLIASLRNEGFSSSQIAQKLHLSIGIVTYMVTRLIGGGRIAPRTRGRPPRKLDENSIQVKAIISLKKRRASLKEMGSILNVTRESARQLVKYVAEKFGEDVFTPDEPLWTVSEVALKMGLDKTVIKKLCRDGKIFFKRRGNESSAYLLTDKSISDLMEIAKLRSETIKKQCIICGCMFSSGYNRVTCLSKKCIEERKKVSRKKLLSKKCNADSLTGWHVALRQKLQLHKLPESEQWMTLGEAAKVTGLSSTQIWWLTKRGILDTSCHVTKMWRRHPVATYSASQMEIVRQVYAEHLPENNKNTG